MLKILEYLIRLFISYWWVYPKPNPLEQKKNQAAAKIQDLWRDYMVRRDRLPAPIQPDEFPFLTYVVGNEPMPNYPFPKLGNQPFVFIGTGALRNFKWIKEMVGSDLAKAQNHPIPQLFIVDNSTKVREFWGHLGTAFAASTTYEAFKYHISKMNATLRDCANFKGVEIGTLIIYAMDNLISDNPVFWYNYFKKITANLRFICADWTNPKVTTFINANTDPQLPKYIYFSNIIEYRVTANYNQRSWNQNQKILSNLDALKNSQKVIHTRTTLKKATEESEKEGNSFFNGSPDCVIFINKNEKKDTYFSKLDDPLYIPLDEKRYEEVRPKGWGRTGSSVRLLNLILMSVSDHPASQPVPAQALKASISRSDDKNETGYMGLKKGFLK